LTRFCSTPKITNLGGLHRPWYFTHCNCICFSRATYSIHGLLHIYWISISKVGKLTLIALSLRLGFKSNSNQGTFVTNTNRMTIVQLYGYDDETQWRINKNNYEKHKNKNTRRSRILWNNQENIFNNAFIKLIFHNHLKFQWLQNVGIYNLPTATVILL